MPLAKSVHDPDFHESVNRAEVVSMAKSIFDAARRQELQMRLARLAPDQAPRWGKFTAPRMVVHLADAMKMAFGDLPTKPRRSALRFPVVKHLVIYIMPWPKGVPTAPELLARAPDAWNGEVVTLSALIERFGKESDRKSWPPHPAFGALSRRTWGALVYRHADHHFQQFGI
jgi:hypothetical protein